MVVCGGVLCPPRSFDGAASSKVKEAEEGPKRPRALQRFCIYFGVRRIFTRAARP